MTNAELLAKIKAEIERRRCVFNHKAVYRELDELLSFLSTLESEKPMQDGLEKEIDEISIHVPCSEFTHESEYIDLLDWLKEQFTYFYDLGCRRTAEKYDEIEYNRQRASGSSEIPNDLEEAAKEYAEGIIQREDALMCKQAFIAGAKWQEEHTPLPEDTVLFNKGIAAGKRLMIEEAVEGEVMLNPYPTICLDDCKDYDFKDGEKVRIIIV